MSMQTCKPMPAINTRDNCLHRVMPLVEVDMFGNGHQLVLRDRARNTPSSFLAINSLVGAQLLFVPPSRGCKLDFPAHRTALIENVCQLIATFS